MDLPRLSGGPFWPCAGPTRSTLAPAIADTTTSGLDLVDLQGLQVDQRAARRDIQVLICATTLLTALDGVEDPVTAPTHGQGASPATSPVNGGGRVRQDASWETNGPGRLIQGSGANWWSPGGPQGPEMDEYAASVRKTNPTQQGTTSLYRLTDAD